MFFSSCALTTSSVVAKQCSVCTSQVCSQFNFALVCTEHCNSPVHWISSYIISMSVQLVLLI